MHPRQSSAKADDCGDARPFDTTKRKKNSKMKKYKLIYLIPIIFITACQSGEQIVVNEGILSCLLYTSDAADE